MALTPEQEWILIGCGLIAHADRIVEVGEWDQVIRLLDERLAPELQDEWIERLGDRGALEQRFASLDPLPPALCERVLKRSWRMALSDGAGSEVEADVHDRIAERLGVDLAQVTAWRTQWSERAEKRGELVMGFAGIMANLDGRMDSAEAVEFEALLERMPVPVSRRLDLAELLHNPPVLDDVVKGLAALPVDDRIATLSELVPIVHASARGQREREALLDLAQRIGVPKPAAERLLE